MHGTADFYISNSYQRNFTSQGHRFFYAMEQHILPEGELCVKDIAVSTGMSQSSISHQLKASSNSGARSYSSTPQI